LKTISATGAEPATLAISGGKGNSSFPEIHVIARAMDENGQERTIAGWFNRNDLLDAITDADAVSSRTRLSEPAVGE
jgi:hypothetical protein